MTTQTCCCPELHEVCFLLANWQQDPARTWGPLWADLLRSKKAVGVGTLHCSFHTCSIASWKGTRPDHCGLLALNTEAWFASTRTQSRLLRASLPDRTLHSQGILQGALRTPCYVGLRQGLLYKATSLFKTQRCVWKMGWKDCESQRWLQGNSIFQAQQGRCTNELTTMVTIPAPAPAGKTFKI